MGQRGPNEVCSTSAYVSYLVSTVLRRVTWSLNLIEQWMFGTPNGLRTLTSETVRSVSNARLRKGADLNSTLIADNVELV